MVLCVANEASHHLSTSLLRPITGRLAGLLCPSFSLSEDALVPIHAKWKPHNATSQNVIVVQEHAMLSSLRYQSILYRYGGTLGPSILYRYGTVYISLRDEKLVGHL